MSRFAPHLSQRGAYLLPHSHLFALIQQFLIVIFSDFRQLCIGSTTKKPHQVLLASYIWLQLSLCLYAKNIVGWERKRERETLKKHVISLVGFRNVSVFSFHLVIFILFGNYSNLKVSPISKIIFAISIIFGKVLKLKSSFMMIWSHSMASFFSSE